MAVEDHRQGAIRGGFRHVTDIAPTIYEAAGITPPDEVNGEKQTPLEGKSFVDSFSDGKAKSKHTTQVFRDGRQSRHLQGWLVGRVRATSFRGRRSSGLARPSPNIRGSFTISKRTIARRRDLAKENPEKLKELQALFDQEAKRTNIYPLAPVPALLTSGSTERKQLVFREGTNRIPVVIGPRTGSRSHTITAQVDIPQAGAKGVIIAEGGHLGGYVIYLDDQGRAVYETNAHGNVTGRIVSAAAVPPGKATVTLDFSVEGDESNPLIKVARGLGRIPQPGTARLSVNGASVGEAKISNLFINYHETLDVGADLGTPISDNYSVPFKFTGKIETVTLDLK